VDDRIRRLGTGVALAALTVLAACSSSKFKPGEPHAGRSGGTSSADGGPAGAGSGGAEKAGAGGQGGSVTPVGQGGAVTSTGGRGVDAGPCEDGRVQCSDGSCADLATDANHCGSCDQACDALGTDTRACEKGVCRPKCDAAHRDCNGDGRDGCEVDVASDPDNCGGCGQVCSSARVRQRQCIDSVCRPACRGEYGDCSTPAAFPDDGCEMPLDQSANCGRCGHDCLGGQCGAYRCLAVEVASGLHEPTSVAVHDTFVHWTESPSAGTTTASVYSKSLTGGPAVVLSEENPRYAIAAGQFLYWSVSVSTAARAVRRRDVTGMTVETVVSSANVAFPRALVEAAGYLYFVDGPSFPSGGNPPNAVRRVSLSLPLPATPEPVVSSATWAPFGIRADATHLYIAALPLLRVPLAGGNPATLRPQSSGDGTFAIDDTHVYFSHGELRRILKAGGGTEEIVSPDTPNENTIEVDESFVYYATASGIFRVPKAGGTPSPLSTDVSAVSDLVLHGGVLYWTNRGAAGTATGSVYRIAL
jgi:hypothetical protein